MKISRIIAGFVLGLISYAVGGVILGILTGLSTLIAVVPFSIAITETTVTAAALAGNLLAIFVFEKFCPERQPKIVFCCILILLALASLILFLSTNQYSLIWFSILSCIINIASLLSKAEKA